MWTYCMVAVHRHLLEAQTDAYQCRFVTADQHATGLTLLFGQWSPAHGGCADTPHLLCIL